MQRLKDKERRALEAVQQADAEEAHRAFCWGLLSSEYKRRALMLARLDPHRCGDPLSTFSPAERGLIHWAASACATQMELIAQVTGVVSPLTGMISKPVDRSAVPRGILPPNVH